MTTPDLKALSDAATDGPWGKHEGDSTHDVSVMRDAGKYPVARFKHAHTAAYVETLVNAHRAGQLFTAAQIKAAVLAEREACAMVAEGYFIASGIAYDKSHNDPYPNRCHQKGKEVSARIIMEHIRARTTQEGET